jgi:hypothetical protein
LPTVQCRRSWHACQHEGEITEGARFHRVPAPGIATGGEAAAVRGAHQLMDGLESFARRVIEIGGRLRVNPPQPMALKIAVS